jgi:hypothetical protein
VIAISTDGDTLADLEFAGQDYTWLGRRAHDATLFNVPSYSIDRLAPAPAAVIKRSGP